MIQIQIFKQMGPQIASITRKAAILRGKNIKITFHTRTLKVGFGYCDLEFGIYL